MRILLTNITLSGRTGTETVTRDLALGYLRAGHEPMVYTRTLGPIAEELRARSIPVADRIDDIAGGFDVIHGHHLNACVAVFAKFPNIPAISVVHDFTAWHDAPPKLAQIRRYVAISDGFAYRLTGEAGISEGVTRVILNGVDTDRFRPGAAVQSAPRRALAFAKNEGHVEAIRTACEARGILVDFVGHAVGKVIGAPETVLNDYDLVFTSARSAIEALACERAVIVCDGRGMAGMVDLDRYPKWRRENFGLRTFSRPVTVENCLEEIDRYDARVAHDVGSKLRGDARLSDWVAQYVSILDEALASPKPSQDLTQACLASHLEQWSPSGSPAWPWMIERQELLDNNDALLQELKTLSPNQVVEFGTNSCASEYVRLKGFHNVEAWGRWSGAESVCIVMRSPEIDGNFAIELGAHLLIPEANSSLSISASVNNLHGEKWFFNSEESFEHKLLYINIDNKSLSAPFLRINFEISSLIRPVDFGINGDTRRLRLAIRHLKIISAQ